MADDDGEVYEDDAELDDRRTSLASQSGKAAVTNVESVGKKAEKSAVSSSTKTTKSETSKVRASVSKASPEPGATAAGADVSKTAKKDKSKSPSSTKSAKKDGAEGGTTEERKSTVKKRASEAKVQEVTELTEDVPLVSGAVVNPPVAEASATKTAKKKSLAGAILAEARKMEAAEGEASGAPGSSWDADEMGTVPAPAPAPASAPVPAPAPADTGKKAGAKSAEVPAAKGAEGAKAPSATTAAASKVEAKPAKDDKKPTPTTAAPSAAKTGAEEAKPKAPTKDEPIPIKVPTTHTNPAICLTS